MGEKKLFVREATGLLKEWNALDIFCITMGALVGISFVQFPLQMWGQYPGCDYFLAFTMGAIPLFIATTCTLLLSVTLPRSGGPYIWISRYVSPTIGYICGWLAVIGFPIAFGTVSAMTVPYITDMLRTVAVVTGNAALFSTAATLAQPFYQYLLCVIVTALFALPLFLGRTTMRAFIYATTLSMLIFMAIIAIFLLVTPPTSFVEAWDKAFGPGAYAQVATAAAAHGWTAEKYLTLNWEAIASGTVASMLMWGGVSHWGSWLSGEVRRPVRTQIVGTWGIWLVAYLFAMILGYANIAVAGKEFVTQLWVAYKYLPYLQGIAPTMSLMVGVVAPLFGDIAAIIGLAAIASMFYYSLKDTPPFVAMVSRAVFAMSFDRMFPQKFAELDKRFHQPVYAHLLETLLLIFYAVVAITLGFWVLAGWYAFAVGINAFFMGIALASLPFTRRDVYEASPKIIQKEIVGVPMVTIIGAASAALWFFMLGNTMKSIVTATNGLMLLLIQVFAYFFGGLILYAYFHLRNERMKISVRAIYQEIPPD